MVDEESSVDMEPPDTRYNHVPGWWLWGGPLWRGFVRGMPVGIAGWWCPIIAYIAILLANRDLIPKDVPLFPASLAGLCFILCVLISLYNWPTILVPPHLRPQYGAFEEWLGKGNGGGGLVPSSH